MTNSLKGWIGGLNSAFPFLMGSTVWWRMQKWTNSHQHTSCSWTSTTSTLTPPPHRFQGKTWCELTWHFIHNWVIKAFQWIICWWLLVHSGRVWKSHLRWWMVRMSSILRFQELKISQVSPSITPKKYEF